MMCEDDYDDGDVTMIALMTIMSQVKESRETREKTSQTSPKKPLRSLGKKSNGQTGSDQVRTRVVILSIGMEMIFARLEIFSF